MNDQIQNDDLIDNERHDHHKNCMNKTQKESPIKLDEKEEDNHEFHHHVIEHD